MRKFKFTKTTFTAKKTNVNVLYFIKEEKYSPFCKYSVKSFIPQKYCGMSQNINKPITVTEGPCVVYKIFFEGLSLRYKPKYKQGYT